MIVGKLIFNIILLKLFFYINELMKFNLEIEILVKYFVDIIIDVCVYIVV